jgi:hypothetical protein
MFFLQVPFYHLKLTNTFWEWFNDQRNCPQKQQSTREPTRKKKMELNGKEFSA